MGCMSFQLYCSLCFSFAKQRERKHIFRKTSHTFCKLRKKIMLKVFLDRLAANFEICCMCVLVLRKTTFLTCLPWLFFPCVLVCVLSFSANIYQRHMFCSSMHFLLYLQNSRVKDGCKPHWRRPLNLPSVPWSITVAGILRYEQRHHCIAAMYQCRHPAEQEKKKKTDEGGSSWAEKTVIAPGEHGTAPGVRTESKRHWSQPPFEADPPLLHRLAPAPNPRPGATLLEKVNWISNCGGAHSVNT